MENLHKDLPLIAMNGFSDNLVSLCLVCGCELSSKWVNFTLPVRRNTASHNEANATLCTLTKVRCHLFVWSVFGFFEAAVDTSHDNPVAQLSEAKI